MSGRRRDIARRFAFLISKAAIGAGIDEQCYDVRHPGAGGDHERGVALIVFRVAIYLVLQQSADNAIEATICRKNQWSVAVCGAVIEAGAVVQQCLRHFRVTVF